MSDIDIKKILDRYADKGVYEANEIVGVWEFVISGFPNNPLRIKVVKYAHLNGYAGIAEYSIMNPTQASPYRSSHIEPTIQEALDDALNGFLTYYDKQQIAKTQFVKDPDW